MEGSVVHMMVEPQHTYIIFVEDGYPDMPGQDLDTCGKRERVKLHYLNKN